jgi:probable H4MPT-linked C1 transfer pathway protein
MTWLALDIGGANLKAADGRGYAASASFPLWQRPQELTGQLRRLISEAPNCERLAVTMTGELADCYASREEGVLAILNAVEEAANGRHTRVFWRNGTFVSIQAAQRKPLMAAAANWRALAMFAAKWTETAGDALLLDIGSTTTDILALRDGELLTDSETDLQRLLKNELVYTGVERSPVCAVLQLAPYRDGLCQVAQELFATMLDVYVLRGDLPENLANTTTADGRPATKVFCRERLARMICAESNEFNHRDAGRIAEAAMTAQRELIVDSVETVAQRHELHQPHVVLSGSGEFLGRRVAKQLNLLARTSVKEKFGPLVSRAAAAHALAVLAARTGV